MPVYTVYAVKSRMQLEVKRAIAQTITRVHNQLTGTHGFLAQVMFQELHEENFFVGGKPAPKDNFFVHGLTRSGRSPETKRDLTVTLVQSIAEAASVDRRHIWVYIDEMPSYQMAEYGRLLPEPGEEANWVAALPAKDREFMESIGRA